MLEKSGGVVIDLAKLEDLKNFTLASVVDEGEYTWGFLELFPIGSVTARIPLRDYEGYDLSDPH